MPLGQLGSLCGLCDGPEYVNFAWLQIQNHTRLLSVFPCYAKVCAFVRA